MRIDWKSTLSKIWKSALAIGAVIGLVTGLKSFFDISIIAIISNNLLWVTNSLYIDPHFNALKLSLLLITPLFFALIKVISKQVNHSFLSIIRNSLTLKILSVFLILSFIEIIFVLLIKKPEKIYVTVEHFSRITDQSYKTVEFEKSLSNKLRLNFKNNDKLNNIVEIVDLNDKMKKDLIIGGDITVENKKIYISPTIEIHSSDIEEYFITQSISIPPFLYNTLINKFELPKQLIDEPVQIVHLIRGYRRIKIGQTDEGIKSLYDAFNSSDSTSTTNVSEAYRFLGFIYLSQDSVQKAKEFYLNSIAKDSTHSRAYYSLCLLELQANSIEEAYQLILKASELDTTDFRYDYILGVFSTIKKEHNKALNYYISSKNKIGSTKTIEEKSILNELNIVISEARKALKND